MHEAINLADGNIYTASQLAKFTDVERAAFRGLLICPSCRRTAYYRSSGARLRKPCFFSRPHAPNCVSRSGATDPWEGDADEFVARWEEEERILVIRFGNEDESGRTSEKPTSGVIRENPPGRSASVSPTSISIQRGSQRVLEQLLNWDRFKTSSMLCRLPDGSELPVHTAFVQFSDARPDRHAGKWLAFWGVVPNLSYWKRGDSFYINFGSRSEVERLRVSIIREQADKIVTRYRLGSINELVGRNILVFDHARISNSGRFTAEVVGLKYMGLV